MSVSRIINEVRAVSAETADLGLLGGEDSERPRRAQRGYFYSPNRTSEKVDATTVLLLSMWPGGCLLVEGPS